jgi:arabinogalactan oligomer/maltooligosaccharide transport system substrate-binding protein
MSRSLRTLRTTTALALAAAVFGAGALPAAAQDPNKITIWSDELMALGLRVAAEQYTADTGIEVDVQTRIYEGINDEFLAQAAAGECPDLLVQGQSPVELFVSNGAISPIDLGDKTDLFVPAAIAAYTYDGKMWGLPFAVENIALLRNADLVPEPVETFDEAIETGLALVESGEAELPFLIHTDGADNGDAYHMFPLQTSMGNTGFALNEAGGWDTSSIDMITIDDEAGFAFAEKIAEWGDLGILNAELTADVAIEKFTMGASPFMITGPWFLNAIRDSGMNYSIDLLPVAGPDVPRPFVGVIGLYLCSKAKNPLASTDFLVNFMTTDPAALEVYKSGGKPPALKSTMEAVAEDTDVVSWGAAGVDGIPLPNTAAAGAYWQTVGKIQQAILRDQGEPAELWAQLGEDMRAKYEEITGQ